MGEAVTAETISPERIEQWRQVYAMHQHHEVAQLRHAAEEQLQLCELTYS